MIKLAYRPSSITQAILDGTQSASLTLANLLERDIPVGRTDPAFGFFKTFITTSVL